MRIKAIFLIVLGLALTPAVLIGWWSYRSDLAQEIQTTKDRNLLVANNLANHLNRYRSDLTAALDTVSESLLQKREVPRLDQLLVQLNIECVAIIDFETGIVLSRHMRPDVGNRTSLNAQSIAEIKKIAFQGTTIFSTVLPKQGGGNLIYAVQRKEDRIAVAEIDTGTFVEMAMPVTFGEMGHAAIVDQNGTLLAHPNGSWVEKAKNLSHLSPVERLVRREGGADIFHSPALDEDVVVGLASVPKVGWGVMVGLPKREVVATAFAQVKSRLYAVLAATVFAVMAIWWLARWIVNPLQKIGRQFRQDAVNRELSINRSFHKPFGVYELDQLRESYNLMAKRVVRAQKQIGKLAYRDDVTKLPNRASFQMALEKNLSDQHASGALLIIDMDNFKEINDLHGHEMGDRFLQAAAKVLQDQTREWMKKHDGDGTPGKAVVARMGGDEFTILVPGLSEPQDVADFAGRLLHAIETPSSDVGYLMDCSASIGCARYPQDGSDATTLLKRADMAMYQAKNAGKNCAEMFHAERGTKTVAEIRHDILKAIANDHLVLHYQPKIDAGTGEALSVEALVRWNDPVDGMRAPGEWLPAITNTAAIVDLGEWVIDRAMRDLSVWQLDGYAPNVAVNVGSRHFITPGFLDLLNATAEKYDLDRSRIEIEITEDALFQSKGVAEETVKAVRDAGYAIAIDDFGKGFSNLARLAYLPVDYLKIDRSIVDGGQTDPRVRSVLAAAIAMARDLGCQTIAEGVETEDQVDFIKRMGADQLQGFHFARPMPEAELRNWLTARTKAGRSVRKAA